MQLYRACSDSYEHIIDVKSVLIQIILFINKDHLNNHGYFIYDEEYYINIEFKFLYSNRELMYHVNRILSINRDNNIDNILN